MQEQIHQFDILNHLNNLFLSHIKNYYPGFTSTSLVTFSSRPDLGQFQSNIAFILAKSAQKKPLEIAQELTKILVNMVEICNLSEVSGFINFSLSQDFINNFLTQMLYQENYVMQKKEEKILIDFGGPNIAKAMHVGHLRSSIIGDSLQRIYRFFGHEVLSDIHLGDWGLPIGMIIMKLKQDYPDFKNANLTTDLLDVITITYLEEIYPLAASQCKTDIASRQIAQKITMELQQGNKKYLQIWDKIVAVSVESLKKNYTNLAINFDLWYGESHVNNLIASIQDKLMQNYACLSEGAIIANTSFEAPLVLVNSEGGVTYGMTDIATLYDRVYNLGINKIIYVVDKRQTLHFKQVFEISNKAFNFENVNLEHVGFGTLNGKDGKPFKTREGGVMKLEDLILLAKDKVCERMQEAGKTENIEEIAAIIGIAALKFADLSKFRLTDYMFDINQFTELSGKTGPYLIYSCVRIKAILNKALQSNKSLGEISYLPMFPEVKEVINSLLKFYYYLERSYIENSPHYLCEHLYNVAQSFSSFYNAINILNHTDLNEQKSMLSLCQIVLINLEKCLELLGIDTKTITHM